MLCQTNGIPDEVRKIDFSGFVSADGLDGSYSRNAASVSGQSLTRRGTPVFGRGTPAIRIQIDNAFRQFSAIGVSVACIDAKKYAWLQVTVSFSDQAPDLHSGQIHRAAFRDIQLLLLSQRSRCRLRKIAAELGNSLMISFVRPC